MNGWPRKRRSTRAGAAPRARSRAPRRCARAARRAAALASRVGAIRLSSGSSSVALRRSLSTASATPGVLHLDDHRFAVERRGPVHLTDRGGGNALLVERRRRRGRAGRPAPRASASRAWRTGPAGRRRAASRAWTPARSLLFGQPVELDHGQQLPDLHRPRPAPPRQPAHRPRDRGGRTRRRRGAGHDRRHRRRRADRSRRRCARGDRHTRRPEVLDTRGRARGRSRRIGRDDSGRNRPAAARAGIGVFATGGLGGVHRDASATFDESADLVALRAHPSASSARA